MLYPAVQPNTLQITNAALAAVEASSLNSFVSTDPERARLMASLCDATAQRGGILGTLHGMTVGIKDLIDVAGMNSSMGSEQYLNNVAARDSAVVSRLRSQGAVILGKTNTHEFAYGSSGDNSALGPVRNPYDSTRMSGGSSSGSAAAVGAGLCHAALGTDTSASVRLPAALCGVVGLKPTYDLLPRDGVFPLSQTLDHVGPITTNIIDNARLLDALTGGETAYGQHIGRPINGLTIGIPQVFYREYLSASVSAALDEACAVLKHAGATIKSLDIVGIENIYQAQQLVLKAEAFSTHQAALAAGKPYSDEVRQRLMTGADISAADYLHALAQQTSARRAFDAELEHVDLLLTPTCGIIAPLIGERTTHLNGASYSTFWLLTRLTAPTNLSGHPSLSVPFGSEGNLPIGLQLIGPHHHEGLLYRVGRVLEEVSDQT